MKVGSSADKGVGSVATTQAVGEGRVANEAKSDGQVKGSRVAPDESTVKLSKAASQLLQGTSVAGEFDAEKVDRVRRAIEDGSYQINAEAIADKLISNAQEVLGRKPN